MKKVLLTIILFFFELHSCIILNGNVILKKGKKSKVKQMTEYQISSVNSNVCKKLINDVVFYAVFVDSKYTNPWTEYDISSTLDSISKAMSWIEEQARKSNVELRIKLEFAQDAQKVVPFEASFTRKTLSGTLFTIRGINVKNIDRWADKVGKEALKVYDEDKSKRTRTKIKPTDRERLLARLRDIHKTDNVALVYFINNYYTDEISVALHTGSNNGPEYAIVSFKEPTVIAHEFLHLFGALDLYISPFDRTRKEKKRKNFVMNEFPNEIMAFTYKSLDSLEISPLTKYLIGWNSSLDVKYQKMMFGKKIRVAKY